MTPEEEARHIAAFEQAGEPAVRAKLTIGGYAHGTPVHKLVLRWLAQREIQQQADSLAVATRAADAAETSAQASKSSKRIALIAIGISILSIVITVIIWYYTLYRP